MSTICYAPNQSHVNQTDDETACVAAARAGNMSSFEELVRANQARIFRIAFHVTGIQEDAEDAMQETFIKAYQYLDRFRGDSRFSTWLTRIAMNEALMKLRKRRSDHVALDEPLASEEGLIPRQIEDSGDNPERRYGKAEVRQILSEAIKKLAPAYRVVLLLRDVECLSNKETAQLLGFKVATVKTRILRARLMMLSKLNRYFRKTGASSLGPYSKPTVNRVPGSACRMGGCTGVVRL